MLCPALVNARWIFLASLLLACGSSAPPSAQPLTQPTIAVSASSASRSTPDAPFRQQPPPPDGTVTFVPPRLRTTKLANGIPVVLAERRELPLVSVQLVVRGGAEELGGKTGVGGLLMSMFELGTKTQDALVISDRYEQLGAHHGAWVGWSSSGLSVTVAADQLTPALELLADIAKNPAFPQDQLERVRSRRLAGLVQEQSSPSASFGLVANAALFGSKHVYAAPIGGVEVDVKAITRADIVRAYQRLFVKGRMALVVAGAIDEVQVLGLLEKHFGGLRGANVRASSPRAPTISESVVALVDKAGPQSQIGIVGLGADARSQDRFAIGVMNAILGGAFSSRVNLNLREKHAYTYGARSWFDLRGGAGPFMVRAAVVADKTIPALQEMLAEVTRMRETDVTEAELRMAKDYLKLSLPARFETTEELAYAANELFVYDYPANEYATRAERYEAVTLADVRKVAQKYLDPKRWHVVVVGDGAALRPELEKLNVGKVVAYEPTGAKKPPAESAQ